MDHLFLAAQTASAFKKESSISLMFKSKLEKLLVTL